MAGIEVPAAASIAMLVAEMGLAALAPGGIDTAVPFMGVVTPGACGIEGPAPLEDSAAPWLSEPVPGVGEPRRVDPSAPWPERGVVVAAAWGLWPLCWCLARMSWHRAFAERLRRRAESPQRGRQRWKRRARFPGRSRQERLTTLRASLRGLRDSTRWSASPRCSKHRRLGPRCPKRGDPESRGLMGCSPDSRLVDSRSAERASCIGGATAAGLARNSFTIDGTVAA